MKLLPSLFSCVYRRVKLFVFAMNSKRRYSIFACFIYGLEEKNSESEVIFAVCRLPLTSCLTSRIKKSTHRQNPLIWLMLGPRKIWKFLKIQICTLLTGVALESRYRFTRAYDVALQESRVSDWLFILFEISRENNLCAWKKPAVPPSH